VTDDADTVDDRSSIDDGAVERVTAQYRALAPTLGRTWATDAPWRFLTDLTAIGSRMAGSDGERAAASLVADVFEDAGVQAVHTESFELSAWEREDATLSVTTTGTDGTDRTREFPALALPYTPSGSVSGELVDVGHGTPAEIDAVDVTDAIAVASTTTPPGSRFVHRMETFGCAVEAGAGGFVFVNHVDGQLPPTGSLTFGEEAPAVAVGVSSETGGWLREYARNTDGPAGTASLSVDASVRPGTSQNVVGRLGPATEERLLLLAHYDGHDIAEAALDNGCGIATLVTAARILAGADLPIGVDVVGVGCEEVGLLGAEHLASTTDLERIRGVVNIDGAGRCRDLRALTHTSETAAAIARAVSTATGRPIGSRRRPTPSRISGRSSGGGSPRSTPTSAAAAGDTPTPTPATRSTTGTSANTGCWPHSSSPSSWRRPGRRGESTRRRSPRRSARPTSRRGCALPTSGRPSGLDPSEAVPRPLSADRTAPL